MASALVKSLALTMKNRCWAASLPARVRDVSRKGSWSEGPQANDGTPAPESPFAKLAVLRDALPAAPVASPTRPATPGAPAPKAAPKGPAKAVVRIERKGRGGKDATIVEQLGLSASELDVWLKALKTQLGCGGAVEGDNLVLQGDLRKRIGPLLEARGVRKVVVG